jgi:hypothetical protein
MVYDELTEKQLKNMKRKLVAFIWEAPAKMIIMLCLIVGIIPPKNLLNKFMSSDFDSES